MRQMHVQRVLTRLGLSAETDGTPKVVRSRLLNAAGLQAFRTFLAHFLHRRRTRHGAPSALAATLAEEGIVVIPEFLPAPVFEAVQAEFRRALDHAVALARRYDSTITVMHVFSTAPVAAYAPNMSGFAPIILTDADRDQLLVEMRRFIGARNQ